MKSNVPVSVDILSQITTYMKYARYEPELHRRELWHEIVERNKKMHLKKYPDLKEEIEIVYNNYVLPKKILPSMRSMQFGGRPIELDPNRLYNCAYRPANRLDVFKEVMFLLLGGSGVGFSVQRHHVAQLPPIRKPNPNRHRRFLIEDSITGWADAVKALFKAYTGEHVSTPNFDYSAIRPKGSRLVTSGGKAPGPEPLRICLTKIEAMLREKQDGDKMTTLEVHDMICHIADAVLSGGIRRAALISLFSLDDEDMLYAKSGNWWELNPQRGRANNSAVVLRHKVKKEDFMKLWEAARISNAGEPGIYFTNDKDWGTNPCVEIALRPFQFCNLTEVNASVIEDQEDLNAVVRAAAFIGTLQAGYTNFHYLSEDWKEATVRDALIGVSFTGIASESFLKLDLKEAAEHVKQENARVAELIGINPAARTTCVKPAGTTSLVLGTSSGVHAWHDKYYIRRIRVNKDEAIYSYLAAYHPTLVEDDIYNPAKSAVISVPQKAPDDAITRDEGALTFLERVKKLSEEWVQPGFRDGQNSHNVSATINIRENEWDEVGEWMWENRNSYNGLSCLPYDGGSYKQAPFETITKEEYEEMVQHLERVDLSLVYEEDDNTSLTDQAACAGGACEIV